MTERGFGTMTVEQRKELGKKGGQNSHTGGKHKESEQGNRRQEEKRVMASKERKEAHDKGHQCAG